MTSGTTGTSTAPSNFIGVRRWRTWNGSDGKYESYGFGTRTKWNSYTVTRYDLVSSKYTTGYYCPRGHTIFYSEPFTYYNNEANLVDVGSITANDRNKALSGLLEKFKGHSFNAAVSLGESHKTANLAVTTLGKLGRSVMALRHGDFSTAARQLGVGPRHSRLTSGDVSGRWLELQYGWKPLLNDVYNAGKALESVAQGPQRMRFSKSASRSGRQVFNGSTAATQIELDAQRKVKYTFEYTEELSLQRQLGLTDPLSLAWELMPYSFVVDWFIPIGTYLSNLNQIPSLKGRWMVTEGLYRQGVKFQRKPGSVLPFCDTHPTTRYQAITSWPRVSYWGNHSSRAVTFAAPVVPKPEVELIGSVHGNRVWNAIALAYSRFVVKGQY